jgi:hypothetical protein
LEGSHILPGDYDVAGVLDGLYPGYEDKRVKLSVEIQVVPEPATFLFLALGMFGIRARRFKYNK